MCKLLAVSRLEIGNSKQCAAFVKRTAELLGASQKDGFGFSLKHQSGLYSERYLDYKDCEGLGITKSSRDALPVTLKTKIVEGIDFDTNGVQPAKGVIKGCYISHGRTATCGKVIGNTHPFVGANKDGIWSIAHNGVVEYQGDKLPLTTTCDSEHLLNCYLYLNGEQSFEKHISGYAAITGINPQGELFVLRDSKAPLYVQYIKELDNYIVATDSSHCGEISSMLCKFAGIKEPTITTPLLLAEYVKHTFHSNGEITSVPFEKFDSRMIFASTSSIYRSLGSAGATGYGDDDWSYYGYRRSVPSVTAPSTPSIPATPSLAPTLSSEELDVVEKHRKEMLDKQKRNSRKSHKPWKENI